MPIMIPKTERIRTIIQNPTSEAAVSLEPHSQQLLLYARAHYQKHLKMLPPHRRVDLQMTPAPRETQPMKILNQPATDATAFKVRPLKRVGIGLCLLVLAAALITWQFNAGEQVWRLPIAMPSHLIDRDIYSMDYDTEKGRLRWVSYTVKLGDAPGLSGWDCDPAFDCAMQIDADDIPQDHFRIALISNQHIDGFPESQRRAARYNTLSLPFLARASRSQYSRFNNHATARAESEDTWIIKGPIYTDKMTTPTGLFCILLSGNASQPDVESFLLPNEPPAITPAPHIRSYRTTLAHIESLTGYSFVQKLHDGAAD